MDDLSVPAGVKGILRRFQDAGYEAYLVGGCVRDALLGRVPGDWDICTAALPEQTMALFDRTVPTGVKHGTVTVFYGGSQAEVTTFRKDGTYTDHRRPDDVQFTGLLSADLARRDFTVNAMAMDLDGNLIDLFGGQEDLKNHIIRCVGDPDQRFREDALRMFRMFRFAAQLGFSIDGAAGEAVDRNARLARFVAPERIHTELEKTLLSPKPFYAMAMARFGLLDAFLTRDADFGDLSTPEPKASYRWAWFCAELTVQNCIESPETFLRALRADTATVRFCEQAEPLILTPLPKEDAALRRLMAEHGTDAVKCAAQCQWTREECARVDAILSSGACLDLAHLAVNGADLQALGYTGTDIGKTLHRLLDAVLEEPSCNNKETLLNLLKEVPHG